MNAFPLELVRHQIRSPGGTGNVLISVQRLEHADDGFLLYTLSRQVRRLKKTRSYSKKILGDGLRQVVIKVGYIFPPEFQVEMLQEGTEKLEVRRSSVD